MHLILTSLLSSTTSLTTSMGFIYFNGKIWLFHTTKLFLSSSLFVGLVIRIRLLGPTDSLPMGCRQTRRAHSGSHTNDPSRSWNLNEKMKDWIDRAHTYIELSLFCTGLLIFFLIIERLRLSVQNLVWVPLTHGYSISRESVGPLSISVVIRSWYTRTYKHTVVISKSCGYVRVVHKLK